MNTSTRQDVPEEGFVLQNEDGSFREKWHTYDSAKQCPGRLAHDKQHPEEDYVKVRIQEIPDNIPMCRFCERGANGAPRARRLI